MNIDTGTNELLCDLEDRVATITLNRPEKRNSLSDYLTPALRQTLLDLDHSDEVGCILITGAGPAFCAGGDVSGMGSNSANTDEPPPRPPSTATAVRALTIKQETLTQRLYEHSKPTLAALPGPAAGAGLSIALACDMRVAAESAFVTTAFRNIGLSGDYGASWLLPKYVGLAVAKELFFTARRVGAEECLRLGLVNHVYPDDELRERARELALSIANGPPIAIGLMKQNLNRADRVDLRSALAAEADGLIQCARTEDHREAVRAFMSKTTPMFSGR